LTQNIVALEFVAIFNFYYNTNFTVPNSTML